LHNNLGLSEIECPFKKRKSIVIGNVIVIYIINIKMKNFNIENTKRNLLTRVILPNLHTKNFEIESIDLSKITLSIVENAGIYPTGSKIHGKKTINNINIDKIQCFFTKLKKFDFPPLTFLCIIIVESS
jgi:hypothetical protein